VGGYDATYVLHTWLPVCVWVLKSKELYMGVCPILCRHVGSDLTTVFADQFSSAWEFAGGYDVRSHVDATLLRWGGGPREVVLSRKHVLETTCSNCALLALCARLGDA
jgi:hypothetical protein